MKQLFKSYNLLNACNLNLSNTSIFMHKIKNWVDTFTTSLSVRLVIFQMLIKRNRKLDLEYEFQPYEKNFLKIQETSLNLFLSSKPDYIQNF